MEGIQDARVGLITLDYISFLSFYELEQAANANVLEYYILLLLKYARETLNKEIMFLRACYFAIRSLNNARPVERINTGTYRILLFLMYYDEQWSLGYIDADAGNVIYLGCTNENQYPIRQWLLDTARESFREFRATHWNQLDLFNVFALFHPNATASKYYVCLSANYLIHDRLLLLTIDATLAMRYIRDLVSYEIARGVIMPTD